MFPTQVDGESVFCLRDPTGLAPKVAFLPRPAAFAAALCDGSRTVDEVVSELRRRANVEVEVHELQGLIDQLDEALFLESARFAAHRQSLIDAFRAAPVRPAGLAGASYPGDPVELARYLDAAKQTAVTPRELDVLVAPHIDFHRGGPVYAQAYGALVPEPPELVVVFGTDHNGARDPVTLTRKRYDTPLGTVETDVDLVDHLAARAGDEVFNSEFNHKNEHSIEFQAVWLRHTFGARTPPMLPVLCGSLHRHVGLRNSPRTNPQVAGFLDHLRDAVKGRRTLVIAAADLAHVGPRFGDRPMTAEDRQTIEAADRGALAACARGDAEGFFAAVAAENDRFRVCGLAPIYLSLALTEDTSRPPRSGQLLAYAQCAADEHDVSFVSIAALTS
jgi:AmmeMemoRadiSam system protein B